MIHRREFIASALATAGASFNVATSFAQAGGYPSRAIHIIVPFAAGGGVDVFARLLGEKLKEKRGVSVVIENRAGGNGSIGGQAVLKSEPDGHTVLFSAATHVMAKQVMKGAPYDPVTDFAADRARRRGADAAHHVAQAAAAEHYRARGRRAG